MPCCSYWGLCTRSQSLSVASGNGRGDRTLRIRQSKVVTSMGRLSLLAFGLVVCLAGPLVCTAQVL